MQRIAWRCVVVILSGETLKMAQKSQPAAVSHLLHRTKIQHSGETVKAQSSHVTEKERHSHKQQPTEAALGNNVVNQKPYDQWIDKHEDARRNDAQITAEMQTNEWFDL